MNSLNMVPLTLALPVYMPPEDVAVGQQVFHQFVHEYFVNNQIPADELEIVESEPDELIDENFAPAHPEVFRQDSTRTPTGYKNQPISEIGKTIRDLANEFAQSHQRQKIKQEADEVDLCAITMDGFWGLLDETFKEKIDKYNVIALFFFCSDVLVRCIKNKLKQLGMDLFKWSLKFIAERVCRWVAAHGGWGGYISKFLGIPRNYMLGGTCLILAAVGIFSIVGIGK
ncbi:uncharacterized protein TNIN_166791 [Trichonephila inaurata madagascariensis]|uniref:Bcl-2 Bcl-2 homology region 1-3 domain-containing protein n=1 Tax=Trichonephila inaurata madagascariensis TaxID=2747483 RepID=A0A8X7BXQ6_9ARAC|nr:uncharacterized protein TNIN_166791 [Trichonephila inaurata madagascariensis]